MRAISGRTPEIRLRSKGYATRGLKSAYCETHLFIQVPRDLPLSGVTRRLVTGLKDILETVRVTDTNSTIQYSKYALF